jgi:hypothetical protein
MKNIVFIILILGVGLTANAQMAIGKHQVDGSGIVDFRDEWEAGIVLPWVTTIPTGKALSPGVLIYNAIEKKVMYYNGTAWVDLSIHAGAVNLTEQDAIPEVAGGTVVGALSSPVKGVLVLETTDKALILPKVASPHLNIIKPMAGTICYDKNKKMMCVYNGTEWSFWK